METQRRSSAPSRARHAYTSFVDTGTKGAQRNMDDWHDFLVVAAGAGAVLAGLVFVGLSINLEMIMSTFGLPGRALEALVMLMAVLVVCCSLLVPAKGMVLAGVEALAVGVVDWAIIVAI